MVDKVQNLTEVVNDLLERVIVLENRTEAQNKTILQLLQRNNI